MHGLKEWWWYTPHPLITRREKRIKRLTNEDILLCQVIVAWIGMYLSEAM
jgi:hypothetical protein